MAAPFFTTPFQPYVYQSLQDAVIPFQILGGEALVVQIMLKSQEKVIARPVLQKNLDVREVLAVDVSCVAAVTSTVNIQIKCNGPLRRAVFGGNNLVPATLTGPGIVFIQSLPFQQFSKRVARAVTSSYMKENPKFFIQMAIFSLFSNFLLEKRNELSSCADCWEI